MTMNLVGVAASLSIVLGSATLGYYINPLGAWVWLTGALGGIAATVTLLLSMRMTP